MEITHRRLPRVDVLALAGRMQAPEAEQLKAELNRLLDAGQARLILDLGGLNYMSSPGLRVMIEARRRAQSMRASGGNGDLRLANAAPFVKEILAQTGFTSYFPIYDDLVEAVGSF